MLLSAMIAFSAVAPSTAYAAENVLSDALIQDDAAKNGQTLQEAGQTLSGLSITDLDKPVLGVAFDTTAMVRTAEGVSWEIPVIWADENGREAAVPEAGHTYLPVFVFFLPDGYTLAYGSLDAGPGVILPSFLTMTTGSGSALYVENTALGVTYITGGVVTFPAPAGAVDQSRTQNGQESYAEAASSDAGLSSENTAAAEEETAGPEENNEEEQPEESADDGRSIEEVYIHCDSRAIDTLGTQLLSRVVSMIKHEIEPKAVQLLMDSFPAFTSGAARGEIGKEIGLYVYYQDGTNDEVQTQPNALAAVNGEYRNVTENGQTFRVYKYLVLVDSADFIQKDENDEYAINDKKLGTLHNTIVHELMHAFMDDYTRTGMAGERAMTDAEYNQYNALSPADQRKELTNTYYPTWFVEGSASCVENIYQFRRDDFLCYGFEKNEKGEYICDSQRLLDFYKDTKIKELENGKLSNPQLSYADNIYIYNWQNSSNTQSAYVSGYLACIYLSKLAAENVLNKTVRTEENSEIFYSTDAVRSGMNYILEQLHDNVTLDDVIKEISGGAYTGTYDFTDRFIMGNDGEGDTASLDFCVDFLNHLEDGSQTDTEPAEVSNGSMLLDNFRVTEEDPLKNVTADSDSQSTLKVIDSKSPVASTVDDKRALMTGGSCLEGRGGVAPESTQEEKLAAKADAPEQTTAPAEAGTLEAPAEAEEIAAPAEEAAAAEAGISSEEQIKSEEAPAPAPAQAEAPAEAEEIAAPAEEAAAAEAWMSSEEQIKSEEAPAPAPEEADVTAEPAEAEEIAAPAEEAADKVTIDP